MEDEKKKNEYTSGWIIGIGLGVGLASTIWGGISNSRVNNQQIKSLSSRDINSDGLADIVVEQNSGDKTIYYNDGQDRYLTAEQMKQREIEKIEAGYREQLRQTKEFYNRAYDGNNAGGRE